MRAAIARRLDFVLRVGNRSGRRPGRENRFVGDPSHAFPFLTKQQQRIVTEVCENKASRKEIALKLGLKNSTLKIYLSRIYQSFGWKNMDERALVITYWELKNRPEPKPVSMADFYQ